MTTNPTSLDLLHDIVTSDPVSWWPLAPGWYVIMLALLIGVSLLSIRFIQQWQKNRFRREALNQLENISPSNLPALVKRVALCIAPREQVASLSGDDWLTFLDQTGNTTAFTKKVGQQLLALSYSPSESADTEFSELKKTIHNWILKIPNS
ncbi:MAG: DUF4381 domain-containing protein [Verrucomicrobiales bacterium]|nr:DUF4381 domain-containing protein [Verrucomicrobiales bacterium]